MSNTFVIADVHGHFDRLEALLKQEGIIGSCPTCHGTGDGRGPEEALCKACDGEGIARLDTDTKVVQLGDLGHFGFSGSPTGDMLCWDTPKKGWIDIVLWGNHDRACRDSTHAFGGYIRPGPEIYHLMKLYEDEGRLGAAYEAHGFLVTHAGLHKLFGRNDVAEGIKKDPAAFATWINKNLFDLDKGDIIDKSATAVLNAVGKHRNGTSPAGGILWRDATEKLYGGFRQVFGHSAKEKVRRYDNDFDGWSWCIDVGDQHNGRLCGIWLPEEKVVEVNLNENSTWEKRDYKFQED